MPHRNYWANCGPIVFCSITISRPIRQAAALSVLPEHTKNPFVREDAPGLLQDKELWVGWMTKHSSFLGIFSVIKPLTLEETTEADIRRALADVQDSDTHRRKKLSLWFTALVTSKLCWAFHALSSAEDWTSEYQTELAAVAMKKLTILPRQRQKKSINHQWMHQISSTSKNTETYKATQSSSVLSCNNNRHKILQEHSLPVIKPSQLKSRN